MNEISRSIQNLEFYIRQYELTCRRLLKYMDTNNIENGTALVAAQVKYWWENVLSERVILNREIDKLGVKQCLDRMTQCQEHKQ